eukprot:2187472-Rhodomonas_salina.1
MTDSQRSSRLTLGSVSSTREVQRDGGVVPVVTDNDASGPWVCGQASSHGCGSAGLAVSEGDTTARAEVQQERLGSGGVLGLRLG